MVWQYGNTWCVLRIPFVTQHALRNTLVMRVLQLTDPDRIRAFLETDRYWADYALGDLEPDLYKLTEWQGVEDAGKLIALTMLYTGFEPPIWFAMGDEPGIEALLARSIRVP